MNNKEDRIIELLESIDSRLSRLEENSLDWGL